MTTPNGPGGFGDSAAGDPLPEATTLVRGAAEAGHRLKILGGLGVRVLCPDFPPRLRAGQDIDLACLGKNRRKIADYLQSAGCEGDRRFNNLNGDRQMYFTAPSGRPIDVMVDRLTMCHTLDFRPSFDRQPFTIDAVDVLLSKLQIVELNEKDLRDIVHLLAALPLGGGAQASIDTGRFAKLLGADWGWWRTVTGNLAKMEELLGDRPALIPDNRIYEPVAQAARLLELAVQTPKSMKWKLRANVGERVRWYELPEEVAH